MLVRLALLLFTLIAICQAIPTKFQRRTAIQRRDANFWSVRTRLTKSLSGQPGDPKDKYFHEAIFHPHYDGRFADKVLQNKDRKVALTSLLQSYLSTMNDIGAQTWIMHGTLMGWWWNRKILPWDSDVDVQMSQSSMRYLADYYNMTMHHYKFKDGTIGGKDYLLEINPHYINGSTTDVLNVIDARWIDMSTGLFIDITSLRRNTTAEAAGIPGMMMCKDKHHYREKDIFPLRVSTLEGVPVRIPHAYTELLEEEYKPISLTRVDFEGHHFDRDEMEWLPYGDWQKKQQQLKAQAVREQENNEQAPAPPAPPAPPAAPTTQTPPPPPPPPQDQSITIPGHGDVGHQRSPAPAVVSK
ncbi:hypothetical protein BT63DRAFT_51279 [Microthyrium microscopicum]|uniref:LicD/FKTN/FKRP nucleotidyltransferase domain-containing protein n=1 Tax=Microthyrium microscopicum TaxID=703497 RepID=A0A6A6U4U4_9PEZI|nr:hypothetical protein BT63DRAFT_51279 [Microthyrium microscopicum]